MIWLVTPPISRTTPLLSFGRAFQAAQSHVTLALALRSFGDAMSWAYFARYSGLSTMHPAMLCRVYKLNMFRATARMLPAQVMNVLARRGVKRFINEAMNLLQPAIYSNMSVPIRVARARPDPAIAFNRKVRVEARERRMCEHEASIWVPGFKATGTGSVHDGPTALGGAPQSLPLPQDKEAAPDA